MKDILIQPTKCRIHMYADDTVLYNPTRRTEKTANNNRKCGFEFLFQSAQIVSTWKASLMSIRIKYLGEITLVEINWTSMMSWTVTDFRDSNFALSTTVETISQQLFDGLFNLKNLNILFVNFLQLESIVNYLGCQCFELMGLNISWLLVVLHDIEAVSYKSQKYMVL